MKTFCLSKRSLILFAVLFTFVPNQFPQSSPMATSPAEAALRSSSANFFREGYRPISELDIGPPNRSTRSAIDMGSVIDLATSPDLPGLVFIYNLATRPFIYVKTEQGCWQGLYTSPYGYHSKSNIGLTPVDGLPRFLVSTYGGFVSRTDNYGESWEPSVMPTSKQWIGMQMAVSPLDSNLIYAAENHTINDPIIGPLTYGELYESRDGGSTWKLLEAEYTNYSSLIPSQFVPGQLYVRRFFAQGMRETTDWYLYDAAQGWTRLPIKGNHKLVLDPIYPNILYAWDPEVDLSYRIVNSERIDGATVHGEDNARLLAHPGQSGLLFLQSASGVYRSLDGGDHWEMLTYSLGGLLYVDFNFGGRLLLPKADGIYVSTDFGETWKEHISFEGAEGCPRNSRFYFPLVYTNSLIH